MIGGHPDLATGAVGCLVVLISISLLRAGRQRSAAVRLALSDPVPETRRAAVLVAARHGLTNHARLLLAHARRETAADVLFTLAEVVRDRGCSGRGSRAQLRRWSEAFLWAREPSVPDDRDKAFPHGASAQDEVHALDAIDALEIFDAVEPPALTPAGDATKALRPAPQWTAGSRELDPLAVVASLESRSCTLSTARTPSRRGSRALEPAHDRDHEALVDRLAGIEPNPRPVEELDRPGRSRLSHGAVHEAATV